MYTSFFGLKENPFNLTPDPRYLFLSPHHKKALDHLLYGINERKGFIAITGGIGTGKTTLCRALLSHLDESTRSALILNAFISDMEILESINHEFGIEAESGSESKKDQIDALNHFLLDNFTTGGNALLLIDEAQNLSNAVLEQIRMISNLETEREKLIQIVLVGQPELKDLLSSPSLRQLNERITVRYDLKPLDFGDLEGYLGHRLVVAGSQGNPRFKREALKRIYAHSRGNPRRINAVCDRALLIAYSLEQHTISSKTIGKAIRDLSGDPTAGHLKNGWFGKLSNSPALLMVLLITLAGLVGWNLKGEILDLVSNHKTVAVPAVVVSQEKPQAPKEEPISLVLDEKTSLVGLFNLFALDTVMDKKNTEMHAGLVSFQVAPEYYVLLKRPFRIHLADSVSPAHGSTRYILIREVTADGAIALDAKGEEHPVTRDFVLRNWNRDVSWVYPKRGKGINLSRGTSSPDVFHLQKTLARVGYLVEPTGVYDEQTFNQVMKFQEDLGLKADGIVGPKTMALLYQMSKK